MHGRFTPPSPQGRDAGQEQSADAERHAAVVSAAASASASRAARLRAARLPAAAIDPPALGVMLGGSVRPFDVAARDADHVAALGFARLASPVRSKASFEAAGPDQDWVLRSITRMEPLPAPLVVERQEKARTFAVLGSAERVDPLLAAAGIHGQRVTAGVFHVAPTVDPLAFLPISGHLDRMALARVRSVSGRCTMVEAALVTPLAVPWIAFLPERGCFVGRPGDDPEVAWAFRRAGFTTGPGGLHRATSPAAALALADLADPGLRLVLRELYAKWPFALRAMDVSQFAAAAGEAPPAGGKSSKPAPPPGEGSDRIHHDPDTGLFFTEDPAFAHHAKLPDVTRAAKPRWGTEDLDVLSRLRCELDDDAEAEFVSRLVEALPSTPYEILAPLPFVPGNEPDPHQVVGICHAMSHAVSSISDDMGVGKTHLSVGVAVCTREEHPTYNPRILAVVPANQRDNWTRVAALAPAEPFEVRRLEAVQLKEPLSNVIRCRSAAEMIEPAASGGVFAVVSYESATSMETLRLPEWDLVVFDESHSIKNDGAQRTRALVAAAARDDDVPLRSLRIVRLSGTEVTATGGDLWPLVATALLNAHGPAGAPDLGRGAGTSRRFRRVFAASGADADPTLRNRRLGRLAAALDATIRIRRLKSDVMSLPPKTRNPVVFVPVTSEEVLAKVRREAELLADHREASPLERKAIEVGIDKLRKTTALAKIPFVTGFVAPLCVSRPTILFTYHVEVADALGAALAAAGARVVVAHGGNTSPRARQAAVDDFQAGVFDVIVMTLDAGGVGYTLTRANVVGIVELDWKAYKVAQAEDRAHRRGQTNAVDVFYFAIEGSFDGNVAENMAEKTVIMSIASGDDRRQIRSLEATP